LTTDPAGNFLFVADDLGASRIFVLAIGAGGGLTNVVGSPFPVAGGNAEGVVVDKTGRFLYVGEENGVQPFAIGAGGALTAGPLVATGGAAEGVAIEATNQFLYVTNDGQGTVAGFSGAGSGALAPIAGSPFATGLPVVGEGPSGTQGGPDGITATLIRTAIP
jgi:DNA-binding beta-propeller fold protein YncE